MTTLQTIIGWNIQAAATEITRGRVGDVGGEWWTIKCISDATGLSKPTCRKYVKILVEAGLVKQVWYGGTSTAIYKWDGE